MKSFLRYVLIAFFAIFLGSQITEGALLVPYWQSLSTENFYSYYNSFGHTIGKFYTVLTIIAAFIPLGVLIYCFLKKSKGLFSALFSTFFAVLFIASFYIYFKGTNSLFFESALSEIELQQELITWSYWHWSRVSIEFLSLLFLILTFSRIEKERTF